MKNKTLSKLLSVFLAVVMVLCSAPLSGFVGLELPELFSVKAEAYTVSGKCGATVSDNVKWSLDTEKGILNITGKGAMADFSGFAPWQFYYDCVKKVSIAEGITSIGRNAFSYCTSLTTVTIGNSVTSIGRDAFYNCTSLVSVTIPYSVTCIGAYAFSNCTSLEVITISDGVTSIGGFAFSNCTSLERVYYTGDIETWCNISFDSFSSNPMENYSAKNFYINNTLLEKIVIPDNVTRIKDHAFSGFKGITSVRIPDSVMFIGDYAFYGCYSLASVTIPDSITFIGYSAFLTCNSLERVFYTGDIESWCDIDLWDNCANPMVYAKDFYVNNTLVKDLVIPDTVTELKNYAFCGFEGITSVRISDSVTTIGSYAFYDCDSLETVIMGEGIAEIREGAFCFCNNLKNVVVPASIITIYEDAFYDCKNMEDIYYLGTDAQWCEIAIYNGNDYLENANKIFVNGDNVAIDPEIIVRHNNFTLDYKGTAKLNHEIKSLFKYNVEYFSSNESVATIDNNGNVTAVGEGTVEITVRVTNALGVTVEDTSKVTVAKAWWQWLIVIFLFGWIWY